MSIQSQQSRTLGGINDLNIDQLNLPKHSSSITIGGNSGSALQILHKDASNNLDYFTFALSTFLSVVSPLVETGSQIKLDLNLLTTATNSNANDFFVYVDTSANQKKMTISAFLGAILSSILPHNNNAIDLGSAGKRWREVFTERLYTDDIITPSGTLNIATGTNMLGNFTIGGSSDANDRPEIYADGLSVYDGIEMLSNIIPDTNNSRNIGSSSKKFAEIRGVVVFGDAVSVGSSGLVLSGNILPISNNAYDIGAASYKVRHIYAHELTLDSGLNMNSNIIPVSDNSFDLGSASKRVRNVYTHTLIADVLSGTTISGNLIPTANNSSVIGASDKKLNNLHTTILTCDTISGTLISGNLIPTANNSSEIGATDKRLKELYAVNSDINTLTINTSIIPDADDGASIGENAKRFDYIYLNNLVADNFSGGILTGNLVPTNNNVLVLGGSSNKFNNIHSTTFTGALSGNATTSTNSTNATNLTTAFSSNINGGGHNLSNVGTLTATHIGGDLDFNEHHLENVGDCDLGVGSSKVVHILGDLRLVKDGGNKDDGHEIFIYTRSNDTIEIRNTSGNRMLIIDSSGETISFYAHNNDSTPIMVFNTGANLGTIGQIKFNSLASSGSSSGDLFRDSSGFLKVV